MTSTGSWDDFIKYLETVYAPSFAPEYLALACPVAGVPEDVWFAAKLIFPDPQAWLDNPIPQLDGQSAREAIAAGKGDTVREIVTQVSSFFLPPPDELRPWEEGGGGWSDAG